MRALLLLFVIGVSLSDASGQERSPDPHPTPASYPTVQNVSEAEKRSWFKKTIDEILAGASEAKAEHER